MLPKPDHNCYLPTPEEIEAACLEIRATWSAETKAKRRVGSDPAAVPTYRVRNGRRGEVLVDSA